METVHIYIYTMRYACAAKMETPSIYSELNSNSLSYLATKLSIITILVIRTGAQLAERRWRVFSCRFMKIEVKCSNLGEKMGYELIFFTVIRVSLGKTHQNFLLQYPSFACRFMKCLSNCPYFKKPPLP